VRSLSDDVFGSSTLSVFISSRVHTLETERKAAAEAVERTGLATAWYWERDAPAGFYEAEEICLGYARNCDVLVLIMQDELTDMTYKEYLAAFRNGKQCLIFIRQDGKLDNRAREFVRCAREKGAVTRYFANVSELESGIILSLKFVCVMAIREQNRFNKYDRGKAKPQRRKRARQQSLVNPGSDESGPLKIAEASGCEQQHAWRYL